MRRPRRSGGRRPLDDIEGVAVVVGGALAAAPPDRALADRVSLPLVPHAQPVALLGYQDRGMRAPVGVVAVGSRRVERRDCRAGCHRVAPDSCTPAPPRGVRRAGGFLNQSHAMPGVDDLAGIACRVRCYPRHHVTSSSGGGAGGGGGCRATNRAKIRVKSSLHHSCTRSPNPDSRQ